MAAFGNNTFQHQSRSIFEKNPSTVSYTNPILSTNHSLQTISDTQTLAIERKRKASEQNGCNQLPIKMNATQQFFCEVCNLQLNSLSQAAQHRQGKSHQINVKKNDIFDSVSPIFFDYLKKKSRFIFPHKINFEFPVFCCCWKRPCHQLDLFQLVLGSTPQLRFYIANWSASFQLGLILTCSGYFSGLFHWP